MTGTNAEAHEEPMFRALMSSSVPMAEPYLIWSIEHRAWRSPARHGYTRQIERAGRYTRSEALGTAGTRGGGGASGGNLYEIEIPESDAIEQACAAAAPSIAERIFLALCLLVAIGAVIMIWG